MSVVALLRAMDSLKKREGDLSPTLKTIFFQGLKNKYKKQTIKEVLSFYKGGSWGSDYFKESIKARVLRSPDIRFGFIDVQNAEERYFTKKEFDNFSLKDNDILVIKSNGSLDLVGKSQIYKEDKSYPFVIASNFLMVLTPNQEKIYPEYLDLFLKSPESLVWRFDTQKTTTGLRNLNSTAFLNIEIPVPDSIEEQRELFELFQLYLKGDIPKTEVEIKRFYSLSIQKEELSTELTHQLSLVKKLRQQLLQDAVQGKIVKQDPKDEPSSELLKNIKAEKAKLIAEKKLKKEKELPLIKPDEIPFEIPENWVWCRLGEICTKIGSGSTPKGSNYSLNGFPFFRSQNIYNEGLIYQDITFISDEVQNQMNGTIVLANDILLNITGGSMGRCALVPLDFKEGNVSQHVCIIRPIEINNKFLHSIILSPFFQNLIFSSTTGAGREGLPKYNLEQFIIPLPPLAEQNRIVQKLDELMQYCNELEVSIKQSESLNEKLLQQVLREALRKEPVEA